MQKLLRLSFVLGLAVTAVWAALVVAQELPVPAVKDSEELRYQFMSHNFAVNGIEQEIYLKLDSYTGKVWRFHASTSKWSPIEEPATPPTGDETAQLVRYEMFAHDYFDTNGEAQELILRTDRVTGSAWSYRGANGAWKDIVQE